MLCIPVIARTSEEALIKIGKSLPLADIIELRIDSMVNVDLSGLFAAIRRITQVKKVGGLDNTPLIITNRKREEGGSFKGSERQRVDLLLQAVELGAEYVDMELSTGDALTEELLKTIRIHNNKTRLIVSSHDFSKTPSDARLKARFNECIEAGADIAKIATYARSVEDNLKVLSLIPYGRRKDKEVIAFCMGRLGRISRVVAPLLGSYLSFASFERGCESAPGQMTVHEMKEIIRILDEDH